MRIKPLTVFGFYIVAILVFALLYSFIPGAITQGGLGILESVYFSTVTITTLGYGDISPVSDLGKILTAIQAVLGILIIGLFLNSLGQAIGDQLKKTQDEEIQKRISEQNLQRLRAFCPYFFQISNELQFAVVELTTPIDKISPNSIPNPVFEFPDMENMFKNSVMARNGLFKPAIRSYYEILDTYISELRVLLTIYDVSKDPDIYNNGFAFLKAARESDFREDLYLYEETQRKNVGRLKELVIKMIKESGPEPNAEAFQGNRLYAPLRLFHFLRYQIAMVADLNARLINLTGPRP